MTATELERPGSGTENPPEPGCPDGRLLALRCLGVPQVITRAPMSRRRALARRLTAFCARIRPRNTAELASLVLHMGEEIDRRERMLDAALRATGELPGRTADGRADSRPLAFRRFARIATASASRSRHQAELAQDRG